MTNINFEDCWCGELRNYMVTGDNEPEYMEKTNKEIMKELKAKVKSWK